MLFPKYVVLSGIPCFLMSEVHEKQNRKNEAAGTAASFDMTDYVSSALAMASWKSLVSEKISFL